MKCFNKYLVKDVNFKKKICALSSTSLEKVIQHVRSKSETGEADGNKIVFASKSLYSLFYSSSYNL